MAFMEDDDNDYPLPGEMPLENNVEVAPAVERQEAIDEQKGYTKMEEGMVYPGSELPSLYINKHFVLAAPNVTRIVLGEILGPNSPALMHSAFTMHTEAAVALAHTILDMVGRAKHDQMVMMQKLKEKSN